MAQPTLKRGLSVLGSSPSQFFSQLNWVKGKIPAQARSHGPKTSDLVN